MTQLRKRVEALETVTAPRPVYLWLATKVGESMEQAQARARKARGIGADVPVSWFCWANEKAAA